MFAAYITWRLDWMNWHAKAGYAVLTLIFFRLLWGFAGSDTARFSRFVASPPLALRHLAEIFRREPDHQVGHNPAGGWMVLFLLGLLFGETLSGLYVANDVADQGPLTELTPARIANAITALHWIFWDVLLAAVALHVLAIAIYAIAKGHDLLTPMITGRKDLPPDVPRPRIGSLLRASLLSPPARSLSPFSSTCCECTYPARSAFRRHDLTADLACRMRLGVDVDVPLAGGELRRLLGSERGFALDGARGRGALLLSQITTGPFFPAAAGPWKCAMVAGADSPS